MMELEAHAVEPPTAPPNILQIHDDSPAIGHADWCVLDLVQPGRFMHVGLPSADVALSASPTSVET